VRQKDTSIPEGYEELASRASRLTVRICTHRRLTLVRPAKLTTAMLLCPLFFFSEIAGQSLLSTISLFEHVALDRQFLPRDAYA